MCGLYGGEAPTVDGLFLKDMPKRLREAGDFAKVPEVTGINREESSIAFPFCKMPFAITRKYMPNLNDVPIITRF